MYSFLTFAHIKNNNIGSTRNLPMNDSPEPPPPPPRNHDTSNSSFNDSKESNEISEAECDRDHGPRGNYGGISIFVYYFYYIFPISSNTPRIRQIRKICCYSRIIITICFLFVQKKKTSMVSLFIIQMHSFRVKNLYRMWFRYFANKLIISVSWFFYIMLKCFL